MATRFPQDVRDLDLAMEMAKRSNELTDEQNASILDTLARVYYEQDQLDEAIAWQEKAVEAGQQAASLQRVLDEYLQERDGTFKTDEAESAGEAVEPTEEAPQESESP